jgi:hypothetical protein
MKSIDVQAKVDDGIKTLSVVQPTGSGDSYQILIDRWFHGTIVRYQGRWVGHLNDKSNLTEKNIQTIGKLIEDKFGIQD